MPAHLGRAMMSRRVLLSHHGTGRVESKCSRGSTFICWTERRPELYLVPGCFQWNDSAGKFQIPSSKLQAPKKFQAPNLNAPPLDCGHIARSLVWNLRFGAFLELGAWSLELGAWDERFISSENSKFFTSLSVGQK